MRHTFLFNGIRANVSEQVMADYGHGTDAWHRDAACKDYDPDLWFPEWPKPNEYRQARAICRQCPVRMLCLADAMQRETGKLRYGMWGGLTPEERERMRPIDGTPQPYIRGIRHDRRLVRQRQPA